MSRRKRRWQSAAESHYYQAGPDDEPDLARICWRIGEATGHGYFVDRIAAESWIEPLNKQYGDGTHWLEAEPQDLAEQQEPQP